MLRYARRRAGLTQRDLAARSGIAQPAIARIESARVSPRMTTLDRLLESCDMRVELTERRGEGVDRSAMRDLLRITPRERLDLAVTEARNIGLLRL
jgi:predicted transcriptional regulator